MVCVRSSTSTRPCHITIQKMKFSSVALCISLFRAAAAESCPDQLPGKVDLGAGLVFHYGILEAEQVLCGKLVSDSEAWVAFGAQPAGVEKMIGAHSIIALPSANTVQQYMLEAKNANNGIVPAANQSLTETSVTQEDGTTVATFKQLLIDDGFELTSNNVYLLAKGTGNDLGYHANRGFVALDFETNIITANPTTHPSLQPSLQTSSPPSLYSSSQPSSQPSQQPSMQSSSIPSSLPSLGSTGAPSGGVSSTTTPTMTPLVTTNTASYPSSQPSSAPSSQFSSKPSSRPSTQASLRPSSLPSSELSSLPSSEPSSQIVGTSSPSSASFSQLTSNPSTKPSSNSSPDPSAPAQLSLNEISQPAPISKDNELTSSSERMVVSMALSTAACSLFAALCF